MLLVFSIIFAVAVAERKIWFLEEFKSKKNLLF